MAKVNIGCGRSVIKGWKNYDNSISLYLAKLSVLFLLLKKLKLLQKAQEELIRFAMENDIKYADAIKHIPEPDNSVEAVYACHMVEHLWFEEVGLFLKESRRILTHGGIIRMAVPDIRYKIDNYVETGDADSFIESTGLASRKPRRSFADKIKYLVAGERGHKWMYDGTSLCRVLSSAGFDNPQVMKEGKTGIADPGELDLFERSAESVYVEAVNP